MLLSLSTSVFAIDQPSCTNRRATIYAISAAFWRSRIAWRGCFASKKTTDVAPLRKREVLDEARSHALEWFVLAVAVTKSAPLARSNPHHERLSEGKNVGTAYIAQLNLKTINLIRSEVQILVLIIGAIKICHTDSPTCSLRGAIICRCCHLSDLSFHIDMRGHFFPWRGTGLCGTIA